MEALRVQMLGSFAVEVQDHRIDDAGTRSQRPWLLLAYMLYYRNRTITSEELYRLFWGDEESKDDPANALRVILHRTRTMLDKLDVVAGRDLIVRSRDGFRWNARFPVTLDAEEFETLCTAGMEATDEKERLTYFQKAIQLYKGNFLEKYSSEPWIQPISAYFHNLYVKIVQQTLPMLEAKRKLEDAVDLCKCALNVEPYSEALYYHLIRNLLDLGDQKQAVTVYEEMRELFISNFDTLPSEEIRGLYYEAIRKINDRAIPMEILHNQLQEPDGAAGALVCDFDFFRIIYYSTARLIARSGAAVHMGLLTVSGKDDKLLSKRSLERVMENLQDQVRMNLRRGDIVTQCSVSQIAVLLQLANYEDSCMVCERVIKAYYQKYPHAPVKLNYVIRAVGPDS